jgi:ring-1,2-phenylacetyl-CoA epoxidase subunit PaaD
MNPAMTTAVGPTPAVDVDKIWQLLGSVMDPEIPVLSLVDLGVVRDVVATENEVEVVITTTYSGCPAMRMMEDSIVTELRGSGFERVTVKRVLFPPWTTDWITVDGRRKLLEYGIVPPARAAGSKRALWDEELALQCPRCASERTRCISDFGSTPCKALYRCEECLEPFEYFKCL